MARSGQDRTRNEITNVVSPCSDNKETKYDRKQDMPHMQGREVH